MHLGSRRTACDRLSHATWEGQSTSWQRIFRSKLLRSTLGHAGPRERHKGGRLAGRGEPNVCVKRFIGVKSVSQAPKHTELRLTSVRVWHGEATYKESPGPSRNCWAACFYYTVLHSLKATRPFRGPLKNKALLL